MRKAFCDGCGKELQELPNLIAFTKLKTHNIVYLETICYGGEDILWCHACTDYAKKSLKDKHSA